MLEGGKYYKFKVTRKTDLGYMLLGDNNEEVLMFYKEAIKEYEVNDLVSAFIYYDKLGRFCATTKEVLATSKKIGLLQVVSVASNGVYLDNLTAKDVLLSSDYLPKDKKYWPEVNDKVFVLLKDKKTHILIYIFYPFSKPFDTLPLYLQIHTYALYYHNFQITLLHFVLFHSLSKM